MNIIQLYEYPELEQVTLPDRRYYNYGEFREMASVTTILDATSDKTALEAWKKRIGEKKAALESKQATGLGSLMHEHLENYVMGIERPQGKNLVRKMAHEMADQIIEHGLKNVDEIWGQEVSVYFPNLYAGTVDLCGIHNGEPAIMDHKTSKKIKKREHVENYFCQLAAYALCHNEMFGTKIRKGVVFMATRPDYQKGLASQYQEYVIEGDEFDRYTNMWIGKVEQFFNMTDK